VISDHQTARYRNKLSPKLLQTVLKGRGKIKLMKSRFFGVILLCAFMFSAVAHAQVPTSIGGLELSPSSNNPSPGQTITVTARSYTIDINSSKVSWYVDGKLSKSGAGMTSFDVVAPALGKKISIEVTATNVDGVIVKSSIIIGSGSVDLLLETDGYTPPFFKGKIPAVYQNSVTIIAVPHIANSAGIEYSPSALVYQWKKNGRALEDQSGYNKQSIVLVGDVVPRPYDISVTVWPKDNDSSASAYTQVITRGPEIQFYIEDPLYGTLFNRSIGSTLRIGSNKETSVLAVPFGFNKPRVGTGDLDWSWGLNNSGRSSLTNKESVVLRAPDDSTGSSNVQVSIRNIEKILQGTDATFSVQFNRTPTQGEGLNF
jgi:hypothetical protein